MVMESSPSRGVCEIERRGTLHTSKTRFLLTIICTSPPRLRRRLDFDRARLFDVRARAVLPRQAEPAPTRCTTRDKPGEGRSQGNPHDFRGRDAIEGRGVAGIDRQLTRLIHSLKSTCCIPLVLYLDLSTEQKKLASKRKRVLAAAI